MRQFKQRGILTALAQKAQIPHSQLSDWKNGVRLPSFRGVLKLAKAENADPFTYCLETFGHEAALKFMFYGYSLLNNEAKAEVDSFVVDAVRAIESTPVRSYPAPAVVLAERGRNN